MSCVYFLLNVRYKARIIFNQNTDPDTVLESGSKSGSWSVLAQYVLCPLIYDGFALEEL